MSLSLFMKIALHFFSQSWFRIMSQNKHSQLEEIFLQPCTMATSTPNNAAGGRGWIHSKPQGVPSTWCYLQPWQAVTWEVSPAPFILSFFPGPEAWCLKCIFHFLTCSGYTWLLPASWEQLGSAALLEWWNSDPWIDQHSHALIEILTLPSCSEGTREAACKVAKHSSQKSSFSGLDHSYR